MLSNGWAMRCSNHELFSTLLNTCAAAGKDHIELLRTWALTMHYVTPLMMSQVLWWERINSSCFEDARAGRSMQGIVRCMPVFLQKFALEDAIGSHTCSLEAHNSNDHACDQWYSSRASTILPVHTVHCVRTLNGLKAPLPHRM